MRRLLNVVCVVILVLCVTGCGNQNSTTPTADTLNWTTAPEDNRLLSTEAIEETSAVIGQTTAADMFKFNTDIRYAERYWWASLSEYGVFHDHTDDYLLDIVVKDIGEEEIFCGNPGCKHPNVPVSAGTPECMAAIYKDCRTAYYNNEVYFFVSDGLYQHRIYVMNIENGERRFLAKMPFDGHKIGQFTIFKDDKMYYTARFVYEDEITGVLVAKHRIMELSLRDGSYRFLTEETEDLFTEVHIIGDKLWVRRADQSDNGRLYTEIIDINTLETTLAIDKHEWEIGNRYIDVYDEDSYYYWDKITYKIGIRNIDGTVEKVLLQGAEGEDFVPADPSGDKLFYTRNYDFGDEKAGAYFMDVKTREVIDITEEAEKYNIMGYDCYYDVFVSEPTEEADIRIWSREKILEEALAD